MKKKRGAQPGKKDRGAQLGNNNALKHGLYSSDLKLREARLLDQLPVTDLTPEINLYRALVDRYLDSLTTGSHSLDREAQLAAMRAVSLSIQAISRFQRLNALAMIMNKESEELMDRLLNPPVLKQEDPDTQC